MQVSWKTGFQKTLNDNKQLLSSRNGFLAAVINGLPKQEMFALRDVPVVQNEDSVCFVGDRRSRFVGGLKSGEGVSVCFYFPLSREKFVIDGKLVVSSDESDPLVKRAWNDWLSQEERNDFTRARPDLKKSAQIETYNAQDINTVSPNFSVLAVVPLTVERTVYRMPQVIADSRNPTFESEFKPYQRERKYLFSKGESGWRLEEVNP